MSLRGQIRRNNSTMVETSNHWKCLLQNDSTAYKAWNLFMCAVNLYTGLTILDVYGTSWVGFVANVHKSRSSSFKTIYLQLFLSLEILINFVSEQTIDEDSKTIHIKDSVKHYLKRKFWFDAFTIFGIIFLMTVDIRQFSQNLSILQLQNFVERHKESDE